LSNLSAILKPWEIKHSVDYKKHKYQIGHIIIVWYLAIINIIITIQKSDNQSWFIKSIKKKVLVYKTTTSTLIIYSEFFKIKKFVWDPSSFSIDF
jgi:hypothetical protein